MQINSIQGLIPDLTKTSEIKQTSIPSMGFGNVLTDLIGSVNDDQLNAAKVTNDFVTGGNVEIHEVMIAGEKAKTSLDLLMEIRNKAVDMYKELNRIQI
ncbi:MAG: flagellar hook-basal body complex protein FliE [Bacteroidota bacterium]|nr:flagellar hook-basal body complex protein FliE [Bacteroidota bacterium]